MKKVFSLLIIVLSIFIFSDNISAYKKYNIGDTVKYNDMDFYVIKESESDADNVTLIKAKSLSFDEVKGYATKIDQALVNNIVKTNYSEYGLISYYISSECMSGVESGCSTDYKNSNVKKIIDAWVDDKLDKDYLVTDSDGNFARLINENDLFDNLGVELDKQGIATFYIVNYDEIVDFAADLTYWTMIPAEERVNAVMQIMSMHNYNQELIGLTYTGEYIYDTYNVVAIKPVITLKKSIIEKNDNNSESEKQSNSDNTEISNETVSNVPNTLKSVSGLIVLIGLVLICVGINTFIIVKNKDK